MPFLCLVLNVMSVCVCVCKFVSVSVYICRGNWQDHIINVYNVGRYGYMAWWVSGLECDVFVGGCVCVCGS